MKPATTSPLIASSYFLVGIATAIIVLQFIASRLLHIPFVADTEMLTAFEHLTIWLLVSLGAFRLLALLLLATWIGQLLQRTFANPSQTVKRTLFAMGVIGLTLYSYGVLTHMWPLHFFGGCIIAALIQGYLVQIDKISLHEKRELVLICGVFAIVFLGLYILDRHRWIGIYAMMPFGYYMLLLSHNTVIQQYMEKRWINPTVIVLSVLSFLSTIYELFQNLFGSCGWLSIYYLIPLWAVILQPVAVYPFLLYRRKKHSIEATK